MLHKLRDALAKSARRVLFSVRSGGAMSRQFEAHNSPLGHFGELQNGGGKDAAQMLHEAIRADFLARKNQEREIRIWAKQVGLHMLAAEALKYSGSSNYAIPENVPEKIRMQVNAETEQLIEESLRKAGLTGR